MNRKSNPIIEAQARELLAVEYELEHGEAFAAYARSGNLSLNERVAVRAIVAALAQVPQQPDHESYTPPTHANVDTFSNPYLNDEGDINAPGSRTNRWHHDLARLRAKEPKPITTAPRDGTVIRLLWGRNGIDGNSPGWWSSPVSPIADEYGVYPRVFGGMPWSFIDSNEGRAFVNTAVDTEYGPTHWLPYDLKTDHRSTKVDVIRDEDGEIVKVKQDGKIIASTAHIGNKPKCFVCNGPQETFDRDDWTTTDLQNSSIGDAFLSVLSDPTIAWRNKPGAAEFIQKVAEAVASAQQPENVDNIVVSAMEDGYTVARWRGTIYQTAEANAEMAWIVQRSLPPFCNSRGTSQWYGTTPQEAILKARNAIDGRKEKRNA